MPNLRLLTPAHCPLLGTVTSEDTVLQRKDGPLLAPVLRLYCSPLYCTLASNMRTMLLCTVQPVSSSVLAVASNMKLLKDVPLLEPILRLVTSLGWPLSDSPVEAKPPRSIGDVLNGG